jgi:hypothetical protein
MMLNESGVQGFYQTTYADCRETTAAYLGRTPWGVRALINAGTLRAVRIDGRRMLDISRLGPVD